ncbi:MAG: hypothetical protein V1929_11520 [bacterium]
MMKKWTAALALATVFASGVIIGGLSSAAYLRKAMVKHLEVGSPAVRQIVVRVLLHELKLTPEQKVDVNRIVAAAQVDLAALRARSQPEVKAIFDRSLADMNKILTEEQQEKVNEMYARTKQRWAANQAQGGR